MPQGSRSTRHRVTVGFVLLTFLSSVLSGGTPPVAAAATNAALQFDGTNDYVTFGAAPSLGLSTFTLEAWIKRTGTGVTTTTSAGGG
ncbi:MAG TPA: hypothetical protein VH987_03735, partial [Candidatus Limnocylindria bacterium]